MLSRFLLIKRFCHVITGKNYFDINSIYSNRIQIKYKNPKDLCTDDFKLPHFKYDGKTKILKLFPSCIEQYDECCEKLKKLNITYFLSNINPNQDILIPKVLCSYSEIEKYEYVRGRYHENNFYNLPKDVIINYLFNNGHSDKFYHTKFYFYNYKNEIKLSPNVLRVYNFDGLTEKIIRTVFEGYNINRIDPLNTPTGYWLLFVGDKNSYFNLLSNFFKHENNALVIEPHYQSANIYPICNKSKNIIEIYSRSEELSTIKELKNAINCEDCIIYSKKIHNGVFYTLYFNDINAYEGLIYKNGLPLNGTVDYIMNFGDKISVNNILNPPIHFYFPKLYKSEVINKLKDYDFEISQNGGSAIINPINFNELDLLNEGIELNEKLYFISASRNVGLSIRNNMFIQKPEFQHDTESFLKSIFKPIPFTSYIEFNNQYRVSFNYDDFPMAIFKNKSLSTHNIQSFSSNFNFINNKLMNYFLPCFLEVSSEEEFTGNINKLILPFKNRWVKLKNSEKNIIAVKFLDFLTYSFQTLEINEHKFYFHPLFLKISKERTSFKCASLNLFEKCKKKLFLINIMFTTDEKEFIIYPQFNNVDQLRQFFIFYSNINFNFSLSDFNIGKDILTL